MNRGVSLTARINFYNRLPIDIAANEAVKQLIRDEEIRRRDHGYKRTVLSNPRQTAVAEDEDDSGSEEHVAAYLRSLNKQRTK